MRKTRNWDLKWRVFQSAKRTKLCTMYISHSAAKAWYFVSSLWDRGCGTSTGWPEYVMVQNYWDSCSASTTKLSQASLAIGAWSTNFESDCMMVQKVLLEAQGTVWEAVAKLLELRNNPRSAILNIILTNPNRESKRFVESLATPVRVQASLANKLAIQFAK